MNKKEEKGSKTLAAGGRRWEGRVNRVPGAGLGVLIGDDARLAFFLPAAVPNQRCVRLPFSLPPSPGPKGSLLGQSVGDVFSYVEEPTPGGPLATSLKLISAADADADAEDSLVSCS